MPKGVWYRGDPLERFWKHVDKDGPIHPICGQCWLWTLAAPKGYGVVKVHGVQHIAHRWIFQQIYGTLDADVLVLHKCDNPLCVNPDHLDCGSNDENMADMVAKGRACHGENCHDAILTAEQVLEIRATFVAGTNSWNVGNWQQICERYGIKRRTLQKIIRRETWKHVPEVLT